MTKYIVTINYEYCMLIFLHRNNFKRYINKRRNYIILFTSYINIKYNVL